MYFIWLVILVGHIVASPTWSATDTLYRRNPLTQLNEECNCKGIPVLHDKHYLCDNAALGPRILPWRLPLLSLVYDYDRYGGLSPQQFLAKWSVWDPIKQRRTWHYPKDDGFQLDIHGKPIKGEMMLIQGQKVDRFGDGGGRSLSAADASFAQRALPPDALNVCRPGDVDCYSKLRAYPWAYHVFEVVKNFGVVGGPIAAAFEQPGGGSQYFTGTLTVSKLVRDEYLHPIRLQDIHPGPGSKQECGIQPVDCACKKPM